MGPEALIDLAALRHNLGVARRAAPASRLLAVIKANAYGHGMRRAARALEQANAFGVARVKEGVQLREAGVGKPLLVLEGCFGAEELALAARHELQLVVAEPEQLALLAKARLQRPIHCWLKVDTGMHRLGIPLQRAAATFATLGAISAVADDLRLMTHLACADDPADAATEVQLHRFAPLAKAFGVETSIANGMEMLSDTGSRKGNLPSNWPRLTSAYLPRFCPIAPRNARPVTTTRTRRKFLTRMPRMYRWSLKPKA